MKSQNHLRTAVRSQALVFALLACLASAAGGSSKNPHVSKVEPPNWWTEYTSPLMVLLYGDNLQQANISTDYPGVQVTKVEAEPDGKHAFLWLTLDAGVQPGSVALRVKTADGGTSVALLLSRRPPQAGKYQGVTRNDVIYLIMPDRFADGDPANNMPAGAASGTYDRKNAKAYHGGDLKGVQDHLPYLKELGVTTLWLTPLYENDNRSSDYHGYHSVDEYAVEDHFGSMRDVQSLVATAHRMGMKVLLDMVPNHVGPRHPWAESQPAPDWLHGTLEHHINNSTYDFAPVSDPHAVPANYVIALDGWFANVLPDLAQENPLVANYLLQNALWWTESSGVDGFRIDTFPYVPRAFWAYYHDGIFATYPHFFTIGEISSTDPTVTSYWAGGATGFDGIDTHLSTPLDFPMYDAIVDVVAHGASARKIVEVLRQDRLYPHPELLVTFVGNHDKKRFLTEAKGSREKLKLAFSLLATLRGIPQLYYGDEVGVPGGDDPDDRHDFPGGFPGDQHNAFTAQGRTPEEQEVFSQVQSLLQLRRQHPALCTGVQKHVAADDGFYAFTRESDGERLLVVLHNGTSPETVTFDLAGTSIADAKGLTPIWGKSAAQLQNRKLQLELQPGSLVVYQIQ